jgi:hypothetical protein
MLAFLRGRAKSHCHRIVSFLFATFFALFLFGLASCGGSTTPTQVSSTPTTPSTPPPTPTPIPPPPPPPAPQAQCPPVTLEFAKGPTTGVAPFPPPAQQPPPNPGTTAAGSVCFSSPADGATVTSPVHVVTPASLKNPIQFMRVFVDGQAEHFSFYNTIDAQMLMSAGPHTLEVLATDTSGASASSTIQINVSQTQSQAQPAVFSNIQTIPSWEPCSAKFPPGHPRAGQICAAGLGDAVSTMTENLSTPTPVSGSGSTVAHFTMGGPTPYSNELYTKYFAGGSNVSHFTYDMYVMVDDPTRPQALEFDVNQNFGNNRWVFGTECNFKGSGNPVGEWDVWDGVKGWMPQNVPCNPADFPANQWVHLVWQFERVGNQVHYISVTVGSKTYPVDKYYAFEAGWVMQDIDVAFQMDGNSTQQPYNVWLDKVTLTAW